MKDEKDPLWREEKDEDDVCVIEMVVIDLGFM